MSSEPRIRVRDLGKKFMLYRNPWGQLADRIVDRARGREHWALRHVDLDLRRGDCVGIVGRNGAGKSTLLELICGILQPSEGSIETEGRIAALLELGAGFNPEFTGRENVFLSGSLYGLSNAEIARRMPAIEDFAGIGAFIDHPVREYSSGMYARLAFSVCACVDADILVVDEILGVGDVRFQQKSMRFMRAFRRRGIVLFVSHNEHAVSALCSKAVWIDRGGVAAIGKTQDVLYVYRRELSRLMGPDETFAASGEQAAPLESVAPDAAEAARQAPSEREAGFDPDELTVMVEGGDFETVHLTFANGATASAAVGGEFIALAVSCAMSAPVVQPHVLFTLRNPMGQIVFAGDSRDAGPLPASPGAGDVIDCEFGFRLPYLPTGSYPIDLFLLSERDGTTICHDKRETLAVIQVLSTHVSSGMANLAMGRAELLTGTEAQ